MPLFFTIGGFILFGDLYNIKPRIEALDNDLKVKYNEVKKNYQVFHKHYLFMEVNELDERVVKHIRKVIYLNKHGNIEDEVEKNNLKIEQAKEKRIEDLAYSMAKDIRKPLLNL